MSKTEAVHNPPAGGDQSQASTNDDNINAVLAERPWVVTVSDQDTVGVHGRFATKAEAEASAKAVSANRPSRIDVKVVKENDPKNGLPNLVAEVEAAKVAQNTDDQ
jgi:hypothetical protein